MFTPPSIIVIDRNQKKLRTFLKDFLMNNIELFGHAKDGGGGVIFDKVKIL